nr:N-acetyl-D-Glu racemase DgcA [Phenylobacterium immobile]
MAARAESWPIRGAFVISRGAKTTAEVLVVEIAQEADVGRGEAVAYARYGETLDSALQQIESLRSQIEAGMDRAQLQLALPAGAARNAIDCALWDLAAKQAGVRAWTLAGFPRLDPVKTCFTISLGEPQVMAEQARLEARRPMLKIKIGGADDLDRLVAVRAAAPRSRLIVDANEAFDWPTFQALAPELARLDVKLVEQPMPAGADEALAAYAGSVPICADESVRTTADLAACVGRYAMVNIKLDKAGGLTEALQMVGAARAMGFEIMAGCMVATSLAMAPALLVAQGAAAVDLDGPLLLERDRTPGLTFQGSAILPPPTELWG